MDIYEESLLKHGEWKGKIEITPRVDVNTCEELSLAYTPGVAQPCLEIQKDINNSYLYTRRWNEVAVITDGTAVLGLGDIGPEAGMPVMEGKCALFKAYGDVDAIPLCIKSKDIDEIVRTIQLLSGNFAGINLEDISAPRCFEIEKRLKESLDIPVFHDDQHGTAIVVGAALLNALKIVKKSIDQLKIVINGAGAAGISIANHLFNLGAKDIILVDRYGILHPEEEHMNPAQKEMTLKTNLTHMKGQLKDALVGADVFVGVSVGNIVTKEMIATMNSDAIVFPLANPVPEISRDEALKGGARIIGTGSSKFPNQINNVLVFPGVFRGALNVRASDINEDMMKAASYAIASRISDEELNEDNIIPFAFDKKTHEMVASAVANCAIENKLNRR